MAHPSGPDDCDGRWHNHIFCAKCDHRVTSTQEVCSDGCCPYCANETVGTVMDTVTRPMRWEASERRWWQVWRIFSGEYVGKGWVRNHQAMTNARKGPPLCDVTVFRGPNGVFSVSQDEDLWSVEKITGDGELTCSYGVTSIKTIFPRSPTDSHEGLFDRRDKAIKAARKWAGVVVEPTHPVPNRRAAIAHAKAQS